MPKQGFFLTSTSRLFLLGGFSMLFHGWTMNPRASYFSCLLCYDTKRFCLVVLHMMKGLAF